MRLGISYTLKSKGAEDWAEKTAALGCRATSFPLDYHASLKEVEAYMKAAKDRDIVIAEVGAWSNPMTDNKKEADIAFEKCVEQLRLADYIGANCACNIVGSAGPVWDAYYPGNYDPDFCKRIVETIQKIIEKAAPKKTVYAIEPMPWMVPAGPDEYLQLIQDVNSPFLGVHLDMVNWMNSFDRLRAQQPFMDEVFEKLHGRIVSCHLKDCKLKNDLTFQVTEIPIGEGMFDLDYYVKKIDEENPELPLLIEHLPNQRAYVKSMDYAVKRF